MNNNINEVNRNGETALIIAAPKGNVEEVRSLLEAGADPCARDRHGMTARVRAQNRGHDDIVALLLDAEEKAGCGKSREEVTDENAVYVELEKKAGVGVTSKNQKAAVYRSEYEAARKVSAFISFLGWVLAALGIIAALIAASDGDARFWAMVGVAISGLFLVAAGQVTRATVDNADHTREILNLLRDKA